MNKKFNKNNKLIGEKNVTYTSFSNRFMERLDFYSSFSFNKLWSTSLIAKDSALFIWPQYNKKEKNFLTLLMVTIFASFIYTIFLPLKLSTAWLYTGLFIYLVGMIFLTIAVVNFAITPADKPVTKGVFCISRNPMYVGWFLIYIGVGIAFSPCGQVHA